MKVTLYGIPNCDQIKKARSWLSAHAVEFDFHDFKKAGVTAELICSWLAHLEYSSLINRKGTTWRNLPVLEQALVVDDDSAIQCMVKSPSVIKRPVLVVQNPTQTEIIAGFSEENYRRMFNISGLPQ